MSVESLTDVAGRFEPGSLLALSPPDREGSPERELRVESARPHRGGLLVCFEGIEDRDAAETLRNCWLEAPRDSVPPLPEGEYYHFELVGCRCRDRREGDLGEVVAVIEDGGGLLLEVESSEGHLLIPFVQAYLERVDVAEGEILFDLPEGLVETCISRS